MKLRSADYDSDGGECWIKFISSSKNFLSTQYMPSDHYIVNKTTYLPPSKAGFGL